MRLLMRLLLVGALLVGLGLGVAAESTPDQALAAPAPPPKPKNIIVIVTDDQPKGLLDEMPATQDGIFASGTRFTNAIIPTTQCCPSRAGLLSGRLAHTTGVYYNEARVDIKGQSTLVGGFAAFDKWSDAHPDTTLPEKLKAAGYSTTLVGKYLNGWHGRDPSTGVVVDGKPAGWDQFVAFNGSSPEITNENLYDNYDLEAFPASLHPGLAEPIQQYSTNVLADVAVNVIQSTPKTTPIFLYFSPYGPHSPFTPAPADVNEPMDEFSELTSDSSFNEPMIGDKPCFISCIDPATGKEKYELLDPTELAYVEDSYNDQHRAVMSVDDAVQRIITEVANRGQLDDTMFVFTSDHGLALGRNRLTYKYNPYPHTTDVDMAIRWKNGRYTSQNVNRIFTIQDLSRTIAVAAGTDIATSDGIAWRPGDGTTATDYGGTLLEAISHDESSRGINDKHPAYCGFRTAKYLYVRYSNGAGEELYDLTVNPAAVFNRIGKSVYSKIESTMRGKAKAACSPAPPGFVW